MNLVADVPDEVLRARRTAAMSRGVLGLCGLGALIGNPHLVSAPLPALLGLAFIAGTALLQLALPRAEWLTFEESLAGAAAILIIGLAPERVTVLSLMWLAAVASGVLARGGRMFWIGRALLLVALILPLARERQTSFAYLAFVIATLSLLLTCGRVTRELRGMLERARHDADHDSLTGTLARAAFRARLDVLAANDPAGLAVLLIDIDGFGTINKTAGHAAGDAVLVGLVGRVRALAGDSHVLGRLGGDEFALVVRSDDPLAFGRRLQTGLALDTDEQAPVEVSIGIARMPADGNDADSILRAVDVALRVAKRTGRRHVSLYAGASFSHGGGGARADLDRLITGEGSRSRSSRSSRCATAGRTPTRRWPVFRPPEPRARCTGSRSPTSSGCAMSSSSPACGLRWPCSRTGRRAVCSASTCPVRCSSTRAPPGCWTSASVSTGSSSS